MTDVIKVLDNGWKVRGRMKELKVSLVTENITDEQLDKLDKFINKVFYSPVMIITTRELDLLKEQTNE